MEINAYLSFDGTCAQALAFYAQALGAKPGPVVHGDEAPAGSGFEAWAGRIIHTSFTIGEEVVMAADAPPGRYTPPAGFHLSLNLNDPVEAAHVFAALSEGGTDEMPLQKTFWARAFGVTRDKFGTPWMINCV